MSFSIIIPSRNAANLVPCVGAVRRHAPGAEIVLVDDGIDWNPRHLATPTESPQDPHVKSVVTVIQGAKPFIFARAANMGIAAARDNDVILLNDDALLETPFGFHKLEAASQAHPEMGLISAVTNLAGNPAQRPQDIGLRKETRTVAFVCVYIPRRTLDRVGLLDERFTAYGWEDNDYCRRTREAGLEIGIFDDCFVDHASLHPTFRASPRISGELRAGREIYCAKWGDAN
jgi:GT2 family glycosyltransferase